MARGELTHEPAPPFSVLTGTCCVAGEQPGSAACCSRCNREDGHQRPGASAPCCRRSTPARPAASSRWSWSPPPRRLHLCAGLPALPRACASLDRRAPRPPAAACFGNGLAGHLKAVLRCSWHVSELVTVSLCGLFRVMLCVRRVEMLLWWF